MIYTCTLNPAIDYHVKVNQLKIGKLNRTDDHHYFAGGKGINVSIVMRNLGLQSTPIGFVGGFAGFYIKNQLTNLYQIDHQFVEIKEDTRMNVQVKDDSSETEINSIGPNISLTEMNQLLRIVNQLNTDDILICSGSLPKGIPNAYMEIARICNQNKVTLVMDTSGIYFDQFLKYKPLFMKPNLFELNTYFKTNIESIEDIVTYGRKLIEKGSQHVMVSLDDKGSVFITKHKVLQATPIKGTVISSVGSGDSMVAGFIYEYLKTKDINKAYQYAVAAATATVFKKGLANKRDIEKYFKNIQIKELNL